MKILNSVISGTRSSLKSWRSILIAWFLSIILASILAIPLKGALKGAFGNSMITEKLADGFNTEVFTDLGPTLNSIVSFFSAGMIFIIFVGFIMNVFLTGGLFSGLRKDNIRSSSSEFFSSSATNFWSFFIISMIMHLIISFLIVMVVAVPLIVISANESISTRTSIIIASVSGLLSFILIPLLLLVVDYARAWHVSNEKSSCFRAIGFGFRETLRNFWSSYLLMLLILLVQVLYIYLVLSIIPAWRPVSGGGILLLFLVSQLLFFIRVLLKVWRYGSVTALMEQNKKTTF